MVMVYETFENMFRFGLSGSGVKSPPRTPRTGIGRIVKLALSYEKHSAYGGT